MSPELRERIIAVLEAIEYAGSSPMGWDVCPYCRNEPKHKPDCKLIACLEALKAERDPLGDAPCPSCGQPLASGRGGDHADPLSLDPRRCHDSDCEWMAGLGRARP